MKLSNLIAIALFASVPALADNTASPAPTAATPAASVEPDNTKVNQRDRNETTLTAMDQRKGSKRDVELTRKIRQLVVKEKDLSSDAKNVKIITLAGKTTLRGPVDSAAEKDKIGSLAARVVGATAVTNELEVDAEETEAK